MKTLWLSFVGDEGFRGVAIIVVPDAFADVVRAQLPATARPGAEWIAAAVSIAHGYGCNPGGDVAAVELPVAVPAAWCGRLLTRAEANELSDLLKPEGTD